MAPNRTLLMTFRSYHTYALGLVLSLLLMAYSVSAQALFDTPFIDRASPAQLGLIAEIDEQLAQQPRVRVIVQLREPRTNQGRPPVTPGKGLMQRPDMQQILQRVQNLVARQALENSRVFEYLPLLTMEVDANDLRRLMESEDIESIEPDRLSDPLLERSAPIIGADDVWAQGEEGSGWAVAVLDTGIEASHEFFTDRIAAEACFSRTSGQSVSLCPSGQNQQIGAGAAADCDNSISGCGHGTHVSGTVAGSNDNFSGIAPLADLIAIQVFSEFDSQDDCGSRPAPCVRSWDSDLIAALDHVFDLSTTHQIAAVNMSLGGGGYTDQTNCDGSHSSTKIAIDLVRGAGIAVVISAGNDGYTNALGAPACISSAISVGSTLSMTGQTNDCGNGNAVDDVSCFSNSAEFLDVLAPGHFIYAPDLGNSYSFKAGTSMAAPHVAACLALLRAQTPSASVDELLQAMKDTGKLITDPRNNYTFPRIDCAAAYAVDLGSGWTLTVNSSGASNAEITASPTDYAGTTSYSHTDIASGTSITLTAPATVGDTEFDSWSDCDSSSDFDCTVVVDDDLTVTATYSLPTYTLTVDASGASDVAITADPTTYAGTTPYSHTGIASSTSIKLTAPETGGDDTEFDSWSGGCNVTSGRDCTVLMGQDLTVTANFSSTSMTQRDILVAFYNATNGGSWTNSSGWLDPEGTECEWYGVICSNDQVIELELPRNNLIGTILPELGQLNQLQSLDLSFNELSGTIPLELGDLSQLQSLSLWDNQLSGAIPPELSQLSQLQGLDLEGNQFSGTIPLELGDLSQLQWMYIGGNELSGSIPSEFGNFNQLQTLDLQSNQLSGEIPPELGQLSQLQWLYLGGNALSGEIPPELGDLHQLQALDLGGNQLSGPIPAKLGQLSELWQLGLGGNQLSGVIPSTLTQLTELDFLDLSNNCLTATDPALVAFIEGFDPEWQDSQREDCPGYSSPSVGKRDLVVSFADIGTWRWLNNSTWQRLHTQPVNVMAVADLDGNGQDDLVVSFANIGTWRWMNNSTWQRLHTQPASAIAVADLDGNGQDDLILSFPDIGTWRWMNNSTWQRLHPQPVEVIAVADLDGNGQDDLILSFADSGTWRWMNNSTWQRLHPQPVEVIAVADLDGNGQDDLVVSFADIGTWRWMNNSTWQRLHTQAASTIAVADLDNNGEADLILSLPSSGTWRWMNNSTWQRLHPQSVEVIAVADLDSNGQDDLVISFGAGIGTWRWMNNSTWQRLHPQPTNPITAVNFE